MGVNNKQIYLRQLCIKKWLCVLFLDRSRHQEFACSRGCQSYSCWSRLWTAWLVQCYCREKLSYLDFLHPGDDLWRSREIPLESFWSHQGKAVECEAVHTAKILQHQVNCKNYHRWWIGGNSLFKVSVMTFSLDKLKQTTKSAIQDSVQPYWDSYWFMAQSGKWLTGCWMARVTCPTCTGIASPHKPPPH